MNIWPSSQPRDQYTAPLPPAPCQSMPCSSILSHFFVSIWVISNNCMLKLVSVQQLFYPKWIDRYNCTKNSGTPTSQSPKSLLMLTNRKRQADTFLGMQSRVEGYQGANEKVIPKKKPGLELHALRTCLLWVRMTVLQKLLSFSHPEIW